MMIYACDHCRFIFSRAGEVETCPDCGKPAVRGATKEEEDEYNDRVVRDDGEKQRGENR